MQNRLARIFVICCVSLAWRSACEAGVCMPGFTTLPTFDIGPNLGANALADLDGNGTLDLLTGPAYLLGDGSGGFSSPTELQGVPFVAFDVLAADFDRDGRLDLVLQGLFGEEVYVLFGAKPAGDGAYLFGEPLVLPSVDMLWHLGLIDIDEDGFTDIIAAAMLSPTTMDGPTLELYRNNGDRTFQPYVAVHPERAGTAMLAATAVGDFDGDGHADVAASGEAEATVFMGDGTGALRQTEIANIVTVEGNVVRPHRLCAADLDGDGRSELLGIGTTQSPENPGYVFGYWGSAMSPAAGVPARTSFSFPLPGGGRFLDVADINRDGALDLVAQGEAMDGSNNFIKIFYGVRGDGYSFEPSAEFQTGLSGHGSVLAASDVDSDGQLDIVLTDEGGAAGEVSLNDARCAAAEAARGDSNADGHLDIGDAVTILSYLFARGYLPCGPAADTNSDKKLDLADAIYLLQHLFAQGAPPSPGQVACRK